MLENIWSKFIINRIIDGKNRKVIVDINGNIINRDPTDEDLKIGYMTRRRENDRMLEHIFRNINDIRIFDLMTNFQEEDVTEDLGTVDINDIISILDYNEYKRIEVEDSVEHLVRNEILGIKKIKIEGKTGCKICKWTDKFKIPRIGGHKSHKPEQIDIGDIDKYFMKDNNLTQLLRSAVFHHVTITLEKEMGIKIPIDEIANKGE